MRAVPTAGVGGPVPVQVRGGPGSRRRHAPPLAAGWRRGAAPLRANKRARPLGSGECGRRPLPGGPALFTLPKQSAQYSAFPLRMRSRPGGRGDLLCWRPVGPSLPLAAWAAPTGATGGDTEAAGQRARAAVRGPRGPGLPGCPAAARAGGHSGNRPLHRASVNQIWQESLRDFPTFQHCWCREFI